METLTPPVVASNSTEPESKLDLLLRLDTPADERRRRQAGIFSVIFHVVTVSALFLINPEPNTPHQPPERYFVRHVTPLYTPPELTQKAPNKGPVKKELTLETIAPHPALKSPAPAPAPKQTANKSIPLPPGFYARRGARLRFRRLNRRRSRPRCRCSKLLWVVTCPASAAARKRSAEDHVGKMSRPSSLRESRRALSRCPVPRSRTPCAL